MGAAGKILNIEPPYAIAGGEIVIECAGFDTSDPSQCAVLIGDTEAQIVASGPRRVLAVVPETKGGQVEVILKSRDQLSEPAHLTVGRKLAGDLHPVANPAFDPDDGALFVTRSGSRGEELPVTLFRIDISGDVSEYSGDIPNPTGIAFGSDGEMFVTSRLEGIVYKLTPFQEAAVFARNLGIATGVAFNKQGLMYVGDRTGTIFKVNGIGEERAWTQVEPSISAFHLAFGPDDSLYVAGPTGTSFDSICRIRADGETDVFFKGLGVLKVWRLIETETCTSLRQCAVVAVLFASRQMGAMRKWLSLASILLVWRSARPEKWQSCRSIRFTVYQHRLKVRCCPVSSSLCNLCVLCVSVVECSFNHGDTEDTEVAQRRPEC